MNDREGEGGMGRERRGSEGVRVRNSGREEGGRGEVSLREGEDGGREEGRERGREGGSEGGRE